MEKHTPVLAQELTEALPILDGATVLDATLGTGGHALEILRRMHGGTFVGIDADGNAADTAERLLTPEIPDTVTAHFIVDNFRNIAAISSDLGIQTYDSIVADLGWGSHQLTSGGGFSFQRDEPLSMCYGGHENACAVTATDIVNMYGERELADMIREYGEERWAVRIAKHIAAERKNDPIVTTAHLAAVVAGAIPGKLRPRHIHPATKTFQAIRIAVNDELNTLRHFLNAVRTLVHTDTVLAIISFHSLEDRIVKRTFSAWEKEGTGTRGTKKPVRPTRDECITNPRSRSAKLRTFTFSDI